MKKCEHNECRIGFFEVWDRMVTLNTYLLYKNSTDEKDQWNVKELAEMEWFTYCPHCGCEVKELLKSVEKTV